MLFVCLFFPLKERIQISLLDDFADNAVSSGWAEFLASPQGLTDWAFPSWEVELGNSYFSPGSKESYHMLL